MTDSAGYFDYNATTPLCDPAREAWLAAQNGAWQNPSSLYPAAAGVRRELEAVREQFADWFDCDPTRIVFTGGATGANNVLFHHLARAGGVAWIGPVEHPAVRDAARAAFGSHRIVLLPGDRDGRVEPSQLERLLGKSSDRPTLVSVMAANNETGIIQPWAELAVVCARHGVAMHCDASQWVGKEPVKGLSACGWVTVSAHKFGGPKGVGLLLIPEQSPPLRLQVGGPQEGGHLAGTENYPSIAAMAAAFEARLEIVGSAAGRDAFEAALAEQLPDVRVIGREVLRLANTSMVLMPRHLNLKWLTRLARRGFAVSTGSACSAGQAAPSATLAALGVDPEAMGRALRFSAGPATSSADWEELLEALCAVGTDLDKDRHSGILWRGISD